MYFPFQQVLRPAHGHSEPDPAGAEPVSAHGTEAGHGAVTVSGQGGTAETSPIHGSHLPGQRRYFGSHGKFC